MFCRLLFVSLSFFFVLSVLRIFTASYYPINIFKFLLAPLWKLFGHLDRKLKIEEYNPTKNREWTEVLRKGKLFPLHMCHPLCYSCYNPGDSPWMRKGLNLITTSGAYPRSFLTPLARINMCLESCCACCIPRSLVFCLVFCRLLFVPLSFFFVLSVLRIFTASYYLFNIFKFVLTPLWKLFGYSGKVGCSCSTCVTHCVTPVITPVIAHEWGKD
jgi:hypothetical protein